jgi:hypothetical protein
MPTDPDHAGMRKVHWVTTLGLIGLLFSGCDDGGASNPGDAMLSDAAMDAGLGDAGVDATATGSLRFTATAENAAQLEHYFSDLPVPIEITVAESPGAAAETIALSAERLDCQDCYAFSNENNGLQLSFDGPLGLWYGLSALLEAGGARFFHPRRSHVPTLTFADVAGVGLGPVEPEMAVRGLHLHTLHPIEGMYAMLMPEDDHLERAEQILRWVARNRGNYIQWPGVDNIQGRAEARSAWAEHSGAIIAKAHEIGLRVGYGVQLFGASNLQKAFDLVEGADDDVASSVAERMGFLQTDPPFDEWSLSFGEFFGAEPADFVAATNTAVDEMLMRFPDSAVNTVIHVGEDQRVDFMDENLIYYFLVKFADPRLIHYVHTVMYYGLFDPASGAYHHENFDEHRDHLQTWIRENKPVAYFPESAYWVAFDISVPVWLPLYVLMRHRDAAELKAAGTPLPGHTLFSSGWEWGYWQFDYATLRFNHAVPDDWRTLYRDMFTPWGEAGAALATQCIAMAEVQYQRLVLEELGPYLAGRDVFIDLGDMQGILAQPDRVQLSEVADLDPDGLAALSTDIEGMEALAAEMETIATAIDGIPWPEDAPWYAEIRDGAWVTVQRAKYIAALYRVAIAAAQGMDPSLPLAAADAAQDAARLIVERRHADLHDSEKAETYLNRGRNPTLYQYGYLHHANTLCYWDRERGKIAPLVGENWMTPNCGL